MAVADEHRAGPKQQIDVVSAFDVGDAAGVALANDDVSGEVAETGGRQHAACRFHDRLYRRVHHLFLVLLQRRTFSSPGAVRASHLA